MRGICFRHIPVVFAIVVTFVAASSPSRAVAEDQPIPPLGPTHLSLGIGIPETRGSVVPGLDATSGGKLLFSLALLLCGYGVFVKYRGNRNRSGLPSELSVTSRLMLTPRTALLLVKVQERSILCAVGPEQVSIVPTDSPLNVPFHDLLGNDSPLDPDKAE